MNTTDKERDLDLEIMADISKYIHKSVALLVKHGTPELIARQEVEYKLIRLIRTVPMIILPEE